MGVDFLECPLAERVWDGIRGEKLSGVREIYMGERQRGSICQSLDSREMRYEYSVAEAPKNFPLRVIGSFSPVGFESVTPLNLLYGIQNRNLPIRAYTYTIPNQSEVKAEYKYTYTTVGDYITGMTIDENDGGPQALISILSSIISP